jgi:hypothetical protein
MIRYFVAIGLACASLAAPASAQRGGEWRHEGSGISLPRQIGEMRLGTQQDASGGGNFDVILQYGDRRTPVTVYVYRSAFPNPALWFERTRLAMNQNVGAGGTVAPRSFTLGDAPAANGLREEIDVGGGSIRATAVAIAQAGEWIVKVRVSSAELDRNGVARRMDQILGAIRFARPIPAPAPLLVPQPCTDTVRMEGRRVDPNAAGALAEGTMMGIVAYGQARGHSGLTAEPAAWCRETATQLPTQFGTLYRERDGGGWVALLGDSGRGVAAFRFDLPGSTRSGVYVSSPASTQVAAVFEGLPHPDSTIAETLPIVTGEARGIAEIGVGPAPSQSGRNRRGGKR